MNMTSQEQLPLYVQLNGKNYFGTVNKASKTFNGVDQGRETFYRYLKSRLMNEQMVINYDENTTVMTKPMTQDEVMEYTRMADVLRKAEAQWRQRTILGVFDSLLGKR